MSQTNADEYLRRVIRISEEMIELAYAGDACRTDAGCGIVFGSLRDKAYKVRKLAESELERHRQAPQTSPDPGSPTPTNEGAQNHE